MFRSAGFRFAAIYAVLLAVSAAASAYYVWWATAGLLDRQVEAAIGTDWQGLAERWAERDVPGLMQTIDDRLMQNVDDDAIYLLVDSRLNRIAGNLERWPSTVQVSGPFYELQVSRAGIRSLAMVRSYDLPGGYHLLIGRDVQVRAQLRRLLTDALLWALVILLALASIGAMVVRSLFRRAIANVSVTAAAIAAGDLGQRVRLSGRGDEFDQLAEVINDMLDRIGRLMDGVRQVSNAIAHDLRTPITRARTRLEDAALHAETAADLQAAIERATQDLDGIVAVFQALLRIAEIEAGSRRAAFTRVDLAPLLADLAELYGAVAEEKDVALEIDLPGALPTFGDATLIQQAVANLLDNAVKFSPPAGTVRLSAVPAPTGPTIRVADQGPGIPAADREHATQRFFRGEAARHTPGSGLGLTLVQAVAHLHGGTLRLEENPGGGLLAVLSLPLPEEGERPNRDVTRAPLA
ncbi:MAG: HAMP domain-containing histidine kinase [Rhodospirillales bacterium]|nr:HAMP domain-containing histidine kinase [Rhodospirillales bacterium]MBN8903311.1 HAMP domain-containing histidine kinase [Rhodospirillales bacterium]